MVAITFAAQPERDRPADDGSSGERAEIAAVETVADLPVHKKYLVLGDQSASLPDRQRPAEAVALARWADGLAVDGDRGILAADLRAGKRGYALQQRHAGADIAARDDELGERFGWRDRDQIADSERGGRFEAIEPNRDAGAGVPDQPGRDLGDRSAADHQHGEAGCGEIGCAGSSGHDAPP